MKIVIIDDEPKVLKDTMTVIEQVCPGNELHAFDDPDELLSYCVEHPCDIAFLDIQMDKMSGVELAEALQKHIPKVNIIFTTAYSDYYKEAMELHASGYLLKPISRKALLREMQTLRYEPHESQDYLAKVQCIGDFKLWNQSGESVEFSRSKSKEAFAYLVYLNGKSCTARELAAALFEDEPYDDKKQAYIQKIVSTMLKNLKEAGLETIVEKKFNKTRLCTELVEADYFNYLKKGMDISEQDNLFPDYEWAHVYW